MGADTAIEWATHTFNPWRGCAKISEACTHCYAEALAKRTGSPELWRGERRRTSAANWREPLRWNERTPGARVFCASLADVFEVHEALDPWRADLWALIEQTPNLIWLLLTKRPENVLSMVPDRWLGERFPANVWVGATAENQARAQERVYHLLQIPAAGLFLSIEPMLGPIDLRNPYYGLFPERLASQSPESILRHGEPDGPGPANRTRIGWVIAGGESGTGARPAHPSWFRDLRKQCNDAGVPFLFKQWGEWCPRGPGALSPNYASVEGVPRVKLSIDGTNASTDLREHGVIPGPGPRLGEDDCWMQRIGKKSAGRLLDGRTWDELPEAFDVR